MLLLLLLEAELLLLGVSCGGHVVVFVDELLVARHFWSIDKAWFQ